MTGFLIITLALVAMGVLDCSFTRMVELLSSHNAFMEDRIAWQETREGMNR